jgi:hypothetical protein
VRRAAAQGRSDIQQLHRMISDAIA